MALKVKTFEGDGKVHQVQLEGLGRDDIFAVRRRGEGYECQVAGRGAVLADRDLLLEYLVGLARLALVGE